MKHVVYIHQYFRQPSEGGSTRSYWISKALINEGYRVTIITGGKCSTWRSIENVDGIKLIKLRVDYSQNMSVPKRFLSFTSFMIKSFVCLVSIKDVDMVFATSTPLSVGFPAILNKYMRKVPFIFEVRDLWPSVPIAMGAVKNKFLIRLFKSFESLIYRNALEVIALSPGMAEGVISSHNRTKVSVIPNMSKLDVFYPRDRNLQLEMDLGLSPNKIRIIHFGSIGKANGIQKILSNLTICNNSDLLEFIFIGGGSEEEGLKEYCKNNGIENVLFLGNFSLRIASEIVNLCDFSLVSFENLPILYTNSPNKLFDSLSAGKPVIVNSAGWTKDLVETNNCGFYVSPNSPSELINRILDVFNDKTRLNIMSRNSYELAQTKYDKEILCDEVVRIFKGHLN